jgi:DNA polymerase-3 subunit alpha
MADRSFVHLHNHTHYSLLDGATRIDAMIARAASFDMPAVAITDHGNLFGAIEFYTAAVKAGIKPIIGCETYLASGHRAERDRDGLKESYHLLLLAMNLEGYRNLIRLSSIGYTEGFYRKPRIDKEVLREHSEGLICTSTCIGGEIPQAFLTRDRKAAEDLAKTYLEIFGPDRFFVELQNQGLDEQRTLNPELIDLADRVGVGVIATNDVHYLEHEDVEAHDILCCINTGALVEDEERFKFPTDQFYFKSTDEMAALFTDRPDAIDNTLRIAEMCNLELDLTQRFAPVYRVPNDITGDKGEALTDEAYLRRLVYDGARERYDEITDELRERIDYELGVICGKGFASYFLIVWDCANYARREGIPIGARGSGCSSVVSHCLYISTPDPIRYGLYFERFMDPDRDEMPDIDLDICQERPAADHRVRPQQVRPRRADHHLRHAQARRRRSRTCRACSTASDSMWPTSSPSSSPTELKITLDKEALQQEPELRRKPTTRTADHAEDHRHRPEARGRGPQRGHSRRRRRRGTTSRWTKFLPLYKAPGYRQTSSSRSSTARRCEKVGLLKMDFLGLRTLSIIQRSNARANSAEFKTISWVPAVDTPRDPDRLTPRSRPADLDRLTYVYRACSTCSGAVTPRASSSLNPAACATCF